MSDWERFRRIEMGPELPPGGVDDSGERELFDPSSTAAFDDFVATLGVVAHVVRPGDDFAHRAMQLADIPESISERTLGMMDIAFIYHTDSLEAALDTANPHNGVSVDVIFPGSGRDEEDKTPTPTTPEPKTIKGTIIGIVGIRHTDGVPSFEGITLVKRSFPLAVLIDQAGVTTLNPAHLTNPDKSVKEVIEEQYPPTRRRQ